MNKELAKRSHSNMYKIRRFEQEVFELYRTGQMTGLAHLYISEEAVVAGVCTATEAWDYTASTHRGYSHLVARGPTWAA